MEEHMVYKWCLMYFQIVHVLMQTKESYAHLHLRIWQTL